MRVVEQKKACKDIHMEDYPHHHPARLPDDIRAWAREMRGQMTDAEMLLWKILRGRRIGNAKFRRQHPMGRYILDFYCHEKKFGIELDGGQHAENVNYDQRRDNWLLMQGVHVLRFWNNQVLAETEAVVEVIYCALLARNSAGSLIPGPSPAGGRREQT